MEKPSIQPLKVKLSQFYLWMVGLYIVTIFNDFIRKPVDFFALALVISGLFLVNRNNYSSIKLLILESKAFRYLSLSLVVMSLLFFFPALRQIPRFDSLIAFGAQYGVHIALAAMVCLVIPLNIDSLKFINKSIFLALVALVAIDIIFYLWQLFTFGSIAGDYSHRWFGDGYVFLFPFALQFYIASKTNLMRITASAFILVVIILVGGTGSRSTYIIILLEGITFWSYYYLQKKTNFILHLFFSLAAGLVAITSMSIIAPSLFSGAIGRSYGLWDRIEYAWLPAISMIKSSPAIGYGFGAVNWDAAYDSLIYMHPSAINFGSPHNWFLSAGFLGGIPALVAQFFMTTILFAGLVLLIKRLHAEWRPMIYAILLSFSSFYILRGMVESVSYKYLSLVIMNFVLLVLISKNNFSN